MERSSKTHSKTNQYSEQGQQSSLRSRLLMLSRSDLIIGRSPELFFLGSKWSLNMKSEKISLKGRESVELNCSCKVYSICARIPNEK